MMVLTLPLASSCFSAEMPRSFRAACKAAKSVIASLSAAVRVRSVDVLHYDIRSVLDPHFLHILVSDFKHQFIGQNVCVFRLELQGSVATRILDGITLSIGALEVVGDSLSPILVSLTKVETVTAEIIPFAFYLVQPSCLSRVT